MKVIKIDENIFSKGREVLAQILVFGPKDLRTADTIYSALNRAGNGHTRQSIQSTFDLWGRLGYVRSGSDGTYPTEKLLDALKEHPDYAGILDGKKSSDGGG